MSETYEIKWAKTNPKAVIPSKNNGDAGYDLYACLDRDYNIAPLTQRQIPTGIAYEITEGWHLIAKERGSTANINLHTQAGLNDNSFKGEVIAFLYNANRDKTIILSLNPENTKNRLLKNNEKYLQEKFGDTYTGFNPDKFLERYIIYPVSKAIQQLVPVYSPDGETSVVNYNQLSKTSRGVGKLGSTGK